jgi:short subunit dehydrogenase-like uncharacterized protein
MVLVFGATGFTGRMVVANLIANGTPVRIAGRSKERLEHLAAKHEASGVAIECAVADVKDPKSVTRAAKGADVIITTVGPYTWWGHVAADAAIANKIPYIDITGEPGWLRKIFNEYGPKAEQAGIAMLPAIGYDYVPGNLAGALALRAAGPEARSIDVGYFLSGENTRSLKSFSGGTLRSLKASSSEMQFAFRGGELVDERGAKKIISFELDGRKATAVSIGATEHLTLPRFAPQLEEVNTGLGWFGPTSRVVSIVSAVNEQVQRVPLFGSIAGSVIDKVAGTGSGSTKEQATPDGPSDESRDQARTNAIAVARDDAGKVLATVQLDGPNPYDLTGLIAAWAAEQAAAGKIKATGTIGPVEAFGLDELRDACAAIGLREV